MLLLFMLHTIYWMSLVETILTLGTLVFTSFLSQAKNARSEFDDEFILQPRKELYWPVAQHLLTLCNRAWARMYVCMYVWDTSSFLKPAGFHHPRTTRWTSDRVAIVASNEFDAYRCIECTCMSGRFISRISAEEEDGKNLSFRYDPKRREPPKREKRYSNSR